MIQTRLLQLASVLSLLLLALLLRQLVREPNHLQLVSVSIEHPCEPSPEFNPHIDDTFLGRETQGTLTPLLVHRILVDGMV